jgi:hypothetical protein
MDNKIIQLEHDISSFITKDNGATVHFEYEVLSLFKEASPIKSSATVTVLAYTVNPSNKEIFLLKSATSQTKEGALEEILEYVKSQKGMSSFTVKWSKSGISKMETSYFYCHDVTDVVKKFFAKKNLADYIVYEIKLNPIA